MASSPEELVAAVLNEEEGAWDRLWKALEPKLYALLQRRGPLGPLSKDEDHLRNIVLEVVTALKADGNARLRRYEVAHCENPELPFLAWLAVVARRIAIDYMRRQGQYRDLRRTPGADVAGAWIRLVTLRTSSEAGGARPAMTNQAAAHALIQYAEANLPPEQTQALARWSRGESYDDIARALCLSEPKVAERLVQSAVERLRRHFRTEGPR